MKGFQFYLQHESKAAKRRNEHDGNVVAVYTDLPAYHSGSAWCRESVAGVYDERNSPVCGTGVGIEFLRTQCKRISEAQARRIHPLLFSYLDA